MAWCTVCGVYVAAMVFHNYNWYEAYRNIQARESLTGVGIAAAMAVLRADRTIANNIGRSTSMRSATLIRTQTKWFPEQ